MSTELDITHDRRCEAVVPGLQGRSMMGCRCRLRVLARRLTLECGTAAAVSDEAVAMAALSPGELVQDVMRRSMRKLFDAVADAGRLPVLPTLHLISEHDRYLDGTLFRWVVLTVPLGTPMSDSLLEVANDWMRARGLRT